MEKLRNYLLENTDELMDAVRELNSWNGCLEHLDIYPNDNDFFSMFELEGIDLAHKIFYGNYYPSDDYVRFDGYGNIQTLNEWEYKEELESDIDEIMENLMEYKDNLSIYSGLNEILEEIEEEIESKIEMKFIYSALKEELQNMEEE